MLLILEKLCAIPTTLPVTQSELRNKIKRKRDENYAFSLFLLTSAKRGTHALLGLMARE